MAMKIDYNPIVDAINSRLKSYKIAKMQFQANTEKNVILQESNTNLSLESLFGRLLLHTIQAGIDVPS